MPKVNFGSPYTAIDGTQNVDGLAASLVNGYRQVLNEQEQFIKNIGLTSFITSFTHIGQGAYETLSGVVLCVSGGIVYELTEGGGKTAYAGSALNTTTPCLFAESAASVFIAHGGYIASVNVSTKVVSLLTSGPNNATHVAFKKGYLIANGLIAGGVNGDINYSDDESGGYAAWEVFNNEQTPDTCNAVIVGWDAELYAFGPKSVEVSINGVDPDNPWEALSGAVMEYGTVAPYSVVLADNTIFWLTVANNRCSIVKMINRAPTIISTQYDKDINAFNVISDARAWIQAENNQTFYVVTFPTENRTFQFNLQTGEMSEKAYWNDGTASFERYRGGFGYYVAGWNKFLVFDHTLPYVYELSGTSDNGDLIRFKLTSCHNDFGGYLKKRNLYDIARFSCGDDSYFTIRYKDDNKEWSNPKIIHTGSTGDNDMYRRISKSGIYRSRQYEIVHSDDSGFVFVGMEAYFAWGGR